MKEKNQMSHGEVQEHIGMTVEYTVNKYNGSLKIEGSVMESVSFECGRFSDDHGLSIGAILDFQEKANDLLQRVKALLADGTYVKVCVTKSAYENVPEHQVTDQLGTHMCSLKQLQFDCWNFADNCLDSDPDEEGAGLYLKPDERYTRASWDMILYWNKDILKSLAEAHL